MNSSMEYPPIHPIRPNEASIGQILTFLHNFPRLGAPSTFSPDKLSYIHYIQFLSWICYAIGMLMFLKLSLILIRRCVFSKTDIYSRRYSFQSEVPTLMLLGFTAVGTSLGFLGEAQVDYGVHIVTDAIQNSSHVFNVLGSLSHNISIGSTLMHANVDDMMIAYPEGTLPSSAEELERITTILIHSSRHFSNETNFLYPKALGEIAEIWDTKYFWIKSGTNFILTMIMVALFISISAIGWSLKSSLRLALIMSIIMVPLSQSLVGLYLSGSVMGADYCVSPEENTVKLFNGTIPSSILGYYVHCTNETNTSSSPNAPSFLKMNSSLNRISPLIENLSTFAQSHPKLKPNLLVTYIEPLKHELLQIQSLMNLYQHQSECQDIAQYHENAIHGWCDYGVMGQFSLWVHQISISIFLFLCVLAVASVWEHVHARDERLEMQYQLLATYEEDNVEHIYLSSD